MRTHALVAITAVLLLASCGGGGGGGGPSAPGSDRRSVEPQAPYAQTRYTVDGAAHSPVVGRYMLDRYGNPVVRPDGSEDRRTAVGEIPRGRLPAASVLRQYLAEAEVRPRVFRAPPVVRLDRRDARLAAYAVAAVQAVNDALPEGRQMRLIDRGDGPARAGEIVVDFVPYRQWPHQRGSSVYGYVEYNADGPGGHIRIDRAAEPGHLPPVSEQHLLNLVAHELVHALGLAGHVDPSAFAESVLAPAITYNFMPRSALARIDRLGLWAVYGGVDPASGDLTPARIERRRHGVWFGVESVAGLSQAWAEFRENSNDFGTWAARQAGSATWSGDLVGLTPEGVSVTGSASLGVSLQALTGTLRFTGLEAASRTWGDGDLGYAVAVRGNSLVATGGDDGTVTGAFGGRDFSTVGGVLERSDLTAAFGGTR